MTSTEISKTFFRYLRQIQALAIGLFLIGLLIAQVWFVDKMITPLIVSVLFVVIISWVDALLWKWVAKKHPDHMLSFFTGSGALRMLLALGTLAAYYFAGDRASMKMFFGVFIVFYFVMLIHHSVFYGRWSNHS